MAQTRLQYLFQRYLDKKISLEEKQELLELSQLDENQDALAEMMEKVIKDAAPIDQDVDTREAIFQSILLTRPGAKVKSIRNNRWWYAAAVVLLVVGSLWFVFDRKPQALGNKEQVARVNDVPAPKDTRAVITLADGSKVYLDSAGNGILAQENNVNVVRNENGEIVYDPVRMSPTKTTAYNTLFNPRGSKVISLTLSDGTKVWLNSESSLKYPTTFANTREVEITGEAYFEVAHIDINAKSAEKAQRTQSNAMPFIVKKGDVSIQVLGTHFNVNAYEDEDALRVTLLEGSVKVSSNNNSKIIKPGEQAKAVSGELSVVSGVDTDEVMAWKNGFFSFSNTDLRSVMRQIARWYDVDIIFERDVNNEEFMGGVSRQENISALLKVLEATNKVHFRVEGRKVIVMK